MGIGKYVIIRLINAFAVLLIALFIVSLVFSTAAEKELKAQIYEEIMAQLNANPQLQKAFAANATAREQWIETQKKLKFKLYGLDKPLFERILLRVGEQLRLKFGKSHSLKSRSGSSEVKDIILEALPRTILLFTTGQIVVILIGLYLGLKAAQKAGSVLDQSLSVFALLSYSLPMWWTGMLFIILFSFYLNIFPSGGMMSVPPPENLLSKILDLLYHLTLPMFTYVFVVFGGWAYTTRNVVLTQLQEDFVMAARAKGVPENRVLYGHVLRASAPPIVTMTIGSLLGSIGGAMISEVVFNWPGMGRLYWTAVIQNDVPVLLGNTTISIILFLASLIVMDLMYMYLDPRVRIGAAATMGE